MRVASLAVVASLLTALGLSLVAHAESPPPASPSASPPPPTGSPRPSPSASPSRSASLAPSPPTSTSPSPAIAPEIGDGEPAIADAMRRAIAATSLAERIDAQRRLAAAERALLVREIARIRAAHAETEARAAELARRIEEDRATLDRLVETTYRATRTSPLEALLRRGSVVDLVVRVDDLARLSAKQRETVDRLRASERGIAEERAELTRQESDIAPLEASVAAKDALLERLAARAAALVAAAERGGVSDASIEVLRELADEAAREHEEEARVIAAIAARAGETLPSAGRWRWPLDGTVTQEFGPSSLALEPSQTYRGVAYPHFHDGIDIAAPLGAPVRSAARGRVAFVGHLGGAMVVIVVHEGGLVSLYGHLDDALARPVVRVGDVVEAGQRLGAVGMTGLTTGPHLHFSVRAGTDPRDPRVLLDAP